MLPRSEPGCLPPRGSHLQQAGHDGAGVARKGGRDVLPLEQRSDGGVHGYLDALAPERVHKLQLRSRVVGVLDQVVVLWPPCGHVCEAVPLGDGGDGGVQEEPPELQVALAGQVSLLVCTGTIKMSQPLDVR